MYYESCKHEQDRRERALHGQYRSNNSIEIGMYLRWQWKESQWDQYLLIACLTKGFNGFHYVFLVSARSFASVNFMACVRVRICCLESRRERLCSCSRRRMGKEKSDTLHCGLVCGIAMDKHQVWKLNVER